MAVVIQEKSLNNISIFVFNRSISNLKGAFKAFFRVVGSAIFVPHEDGLLSGLQKALAVHQLENVVFI